MMTKLLLVSGLALVFGCTQATEDADKKIGIDETFLDPGASPCADFYQYACGAWMREHPLNGGGYWRRVTQTTTRNAVLIGKIIDDDAAGKPYMNHKDADKVGAYYNACYQSRQKMGPPSLSPLEPVSALIRAAATPDALAAAVAEAHAVGASALFAMYASVDPSNPTRRIMTFSEPGFGLPHRDYYLDPALAVDTQYLAHIRALSALVGSTLPVGDPAGVLAFERTLAAGTLTDAQWQKPEQIYNVMSWDAFVAASPHIAWTAYADYLHILPPTNVNVLSPTYLATLDAALASASQAALADYLDWTVLETHANAMGTDAVTAEAQFHWGVFYGTSTPSTPSWQCELETKAVLSYAIAQPFVKVAFGADDKARVEAMVSAIKSALGRSLATRDWLDAPTKAEAATKLDAILTKVGYPSTWPSYDDLVVTGTSFLDNQVTLMKTGHGWNLASLDQSVDRSGWGMSPVTDNAMYSGPRNDITLPAAFVQPPHFEPSFGDAYNYGAIGTTIGHELTHGFDAQGRHFDATGKLRDWWTAATADELSARAACLIDQYGIYEAAPGVRVDGEATVDENIADLGGVRAAYAAYKALGESEAFAGSFGADQQFFLSYAQMWCASISPESAATWATTDNHAPDRFRVNGVVSNMSEFASAFGCPAGSAMVRSPRCEIW